MQISDQHAVLDAQSQGHLHLRGGKHVAGVGWYSTHRYQTPRRVWAETVDTPALVRVTSETWSGLSFLTGTWVTPAKEGLVSVRFNLPALITAVLGVGLQSPHRCHHPSHLLRLDLVHASKCLTSVLHPAITISTCRSLSLQVLGLQVIHCLFYCLSLSPNHSILGGTCFRKGR